MAAQDTESEEKTEHTLQKSKPYYNTHAHPLPDIQNDSNVAIHNPKLNFGAHM